ncbi:CcdC protein domain-containing protein [Rhizorhabdus dicambivorans]|uniref:DUF1453 domain-containing protein n=1 Tax=Rhizorhabdus dicambivorans TaxID=1850238 RepID=A0A2A4FXT0_9SPHN|nr:CcdC protein domain-containing protein [Rhizorhabdus dicambivorans]ATE66917.1 DUF1453 domain-containing protein [Rhizorhabdus dicambivorans]PCE42213.1 DUF1453 domain-containing protein [Rhizorhabdus dicambivorans]
MTQDDLLHYGLIGAAFALALFIRIRRIGRTQRLRIGTLWIIPALFLVLGAAILWQFPPEGWGWLWIALGFLAGGAVGWQRGRLVEIAIDPASGRLTQRSSPGALIFLLLLFGLRWLLHWLVELSDARWHLGAMLVGNIFIAFAVGVLSFYRIELWLRARAISKGA